MSIRDLILFAVVLGAVPFILRRPFIGLLFWVWIGVMNPQQLSWGPARTFSFAMVVAVATLLGMVFNRNDVRFKGGAEFGLLMALFVWMSVTTVFALQPELAYGQWEQVAKIQLMTFVAFLLVNTKKQLDMLLWAVALSIGYYGIKGGVFTLLTGGGHRVYGPGDSVIGDNNAIALALAMIIPIFVYLRSQVIAKWMRHGLLAAMILCGVAVLGSQSRGAFLAVSAMLVFLWLKGRKKILVGFVMVLLIPAMIGFMPETWMRRMETIQNYEMDSSAMQRLNAWEVAINVANDRPLVGGGFRMESQMLFLKYAPQTDVSWVRVAHSIYFQMLGEHGWVGLVLFLALWTVVWRRCTRLVKASKERSDLAWVAMLAPMMQVSMIAFFVGGAFLSLAYWDAPLYMIVAVGVAACLVRNAGNEASPKAIAAEAQVTGPLAHPDRRVGGLPAAGSVYPRNPQ